MTNVEEHSHLEDQGSKAPGEEAEGVGDRGPTKELRGELDGPDSDKSD
jgi:hypothetical protein